METRLGTTTAMSTAAMETEHDTIYGFHHELNRHNGNTSSENWLGNVFEKERDREMLCSTG